MPKKSVKAIFFDRDGTLIIDKHYMHKASELEYFSDTFESLRDIQEKGYKMFMVTNQSGIGRGMFKVEDMHAVHKQMLIDFEKENIQITDIVFCPHAPNDGCDCRKPSPKLILELIQKYHVDPSKSFMIGDKIIDAQSGDAAGTTGITIFNDFPEYKSVQSLKEFTTLL